MASQNSVNNQIAWSNFVEGRLTLLTQDPLPSADQTAKTTLYYTPYTGDRISIYSTTNINWETVQFSETSLDISAYTPNTLYDVFGYNNAGTLGLEGVSWGTGTAYNISAATAADGSVITYANATQAFAVGDTVCIQGITGNIGDGFLHDILTVNAIATVSAGVSYSIEVEVNCTGKTYTSGGTVRKIDNTRATAITLQDVIPVKSGDASRRLLGTICITGVTGQCEDSTSRRYVCNVYNTAPRKIVSNINDADSFAQGCNGTYILCSTNPDSIKPGYGRINYVSSYYPVAVKATWATAGFIDTAASFVLGLFHNVISWTTGAPECDSTFAQSASSTYSSVISSLYSFAPNVGFNYIQQLLYAATGRTVTIWTGQTSTNSIFKFGMKGFLWL